MKTLEELRVIREKMQGQINMRTEGINKVCVIVSMDNCGIEHGARPVLQAFSNSVQQNKIGNQVTVLQGKCIGLCRYEPVVQIKKPGSETVIYINMTPEKAVEVVEKHLIGGNIISAYTLSSVGGVQ